MAKLIIKWVEDKHMAEIYQSTKFQFAFVSSPKVGNKQCHPFVQCRDFLHDAVKSHLNKGSCSIFGFTYRYGKNPPVDMRNMRMLVTKFNMKEQERDEFEKKMECAIKIINHYETIAGWPKSKLRYVGNKDRSNVWLFVGSGKWMKSPFLVSMYSFLIRLGDKYKKLGKFRDTEDLVKKLKETSTKFTDNDAKYLGPTHNKMHLIMAKADGLFLKGGKIDPTYKKKITVYSFHDNCGIYSLCQDRVPPQVKSLSAKIKEMK
jgi:hypothetical protein